MTNFDDVQYAMETSRVLLAPDRRIDTFGNTFFKFLILSELMDQSGLIRLRQGEIEAVRPRLLRPEQMHGVEIEGFDEGMQARFDRMLDKLREQGHSMAFLNYGFRFSRSAVTENIVHDQMEQVRGNVLEQARREGDPALAIMEGVDDTWEVALVKFTLEMITESIEINRFDFQRRGFL